MGRESAVPDGPPEDDGVLDPADTLEGDDLLADPLDAGIEPPYHWSPGEGFGTTLAEARRGESLDQLLAEEEPEEDPDDPEVGDEGAIDSEDEDGEDWGAVDVDAIRAEQVALRVVEGDES